jgi:hypothetical protein
VERPQRASARTNDVDARKDRRRIGSQPGKGLLIHCHMRQRLLFSSEQP